MASKLFRAVVGVGISLGTASAACLGSSSPAPDATADEASTPAPPSPDAGDAPESSADATTDALLDAFCDASWPTTKGNHAGGPTCGDTVDCHEAGPSPYCFKQVDPVASICDTAPVLPAWCVGGSWQCSADGVPAEQCRCWVGQTCP